MHSVMILPRLTAGLLVLTAASCGGSSPQPVDDAAPGPGPVPAVATAAPAAVEARDSWLESDRAEHDFGLVHPDSLQETRFQLTAAGTDDLIVDKVVRSCGCTMGELFVVEEGENVPVELGKAYPPGTEFELLATLNTSEKLGVQKQSVRVMLAGRDVPEAYYINAEIKPFLLTEPKMLTFGKVSTLEGAEGEVTVRTESGEPFLLSCNRELLHDAIDVAFTPIDPDEDGRAASWTMKVRVAKGAPKGTLTPRISLVTDIVNEEAVAKDEPMMHRWQFSAKAEVTGVLDVLPDRVSFGTVPMGGAAVRRFVVRCKDPEFAMTNLRLRMENASPGFEEALQVEATEVEPGVAWQIDARLAGMTRPGPFQGTMAIYVDHPFEEFVTVSFRGAVAAPGN